MNNTQLKQYMRALAQAYQLAKLDCERGVVDPDSEANAVASLWENAAFRLVNASNEEYEWVVRQSTLVDSHQWGR